MELNTRVLSLMLLSYLFFLSACVSKKKYLEDIAKVEEEKGLQIAQQRVQITNLDASISDLKLQLAKREGANEALVAMQDRYDEKIKELEEEIERMSSSAENQQESMGLTLKEKEAMIAEKEEQIVAIKQVLEEDENMLLQLSDAMQASLKDFDENTFSIEVKQV